MLSRSVRWRRHRSQIVGLLDSLPTLFAEQPTQIVDASIGGAVKAALAGLVRVSPPIKGLFINVHVGQEVRLHRRRWAGR